MVIQILKFEHLLVNLLVLFSESKRFMEFHTCEQDANQLKDSPLKITTVTICTKPTYNRCNMLL